MQQKERSANLISPITGSLDSSVDSAGDSEEKDAQGSVTGSSASVATITPSDSAAAEAALEDIASGDVIDDPVRMYLREIGRIPLLTAADERRLALEHASGSHIQKAEAEILADTQTAARPGDIIQLLLKRLESQAWLLEAVAEYKAIEEPLTLGMLLTNESLRTAIDGQIDQEMLDVFPGLGDL